MWGWLGALLLLLAWPVSAAMPPTLVAPAQRALGLIYNMDFEAALAAAQMVIDLAPDSPAGYYYQTATYWQWRLVSRDPQQRQALLSRLQESAHHTMDIAARLPSDRAAEAAFYLGAAHGTQARVYIIERQYFKALGAAKKGGAYLQQCVELEPTWYDAYLGLGVYHYYLARVPGFVRGLAQWFIGLEGNREQGLQELELARAHGTFAVTEATSMLAKIYASSTEKQYDKARQLLEPLVQHYPNNLDYRYRLLLVFANLEQWQQARQTGQRLLDAMEQGRLPYARQWEHLLHYRLAEAAVLQGDTEAALTILPPLYAQPLEDTLRSWAALRLGNVYDLRGDHLTARRYYQEATGSDGVEELAAQYMTIPFAPGQTALKPPEKSI